MSPALAVNWSIASLANKEAIRLQLYYLQRQIAGPETELCVLLKGSRELEEKERIVRIPKRIFLVSVPLGI